MAFGTDASNRMGSPQALGTAFFNKSIDNSLRMSDADNSTLQWPAGTPSSTSIWTMSFWIKFWDPEAGQAATEFFSAGTGGATYSFFSLNASENFIHQTELPGARNKAWDRVIRDPSAWYHFVLRADLNQTITADKLKWYVNGVLETDTSTDGIAQSTWSYINASGVTQNWGGKTGIANGNPGADVYLAEINFCDGQSYGPEYFGENKNGVWIPKEPEVTYGNNGYRLEFKQTGTGGASASTVGADTSGRGNHFTDSGIVATDILPDSPTNNFAVFNSVDISGTTLTYSKGGLKAERTSSSFAQAYSSLSFDSGKWYAEFLLDAGNSGLGVIAGTTNPGSNRYMGQDTYTYGYYSDGRKVNNASYTAYGDSYATAADGSGDVVGVYIDADNGDIYFSKNGTIQNSGTAAFTGVTGPFRFAIASESNCFHIANFGQDDTFAGLKTSGSDSATDASGRGIFYDAPALPGYKAACTANLQEPTFTPRNESIENSYFYTTLYEGNGGGQRVGQFLPLNEVKTVNNSIRFDDGSSPELYKSWTQDATDRKHFTVSFWVKRGIVGSGQHTMLQCDTSGGQATQIVFLSGDTLTFNVAASGVAQRQLITNRKFRDTSRFYHIVCAYDSEATTAAERARIYVDGEELTDFSSDQRSNIAGTDVHGIMENGQSVNTIGFRDHSGVSKNFLDGYLCDFHCIDGQTLTPSSFGQTDPSTEKWIPKTYSGSYGNNGFHLEFLDTSNFGLDSAGTNHFTAANLAADDQIIDTPTDNFPILTNLPANHGGTLAKGNLQTTVTGFSSSVYGGGRSTIPIPKTGKWYCEVRGMATGDLWTAGISTNTDVPSIGNVAGPGAIALYNRSVYIGYENDYGSTENQLAGLGITKFASGDVLGIHVDMDAGGKVWFSHNGTQFDAPQGHQAGSGPQGDPAAGTNEIGTIHNPNNEDIFFHLGGSSSTVCHINFGQNPSFNGSFTGGDVGTQVREGGTFKYMPATGYKPLRVDLLPDQTRGIARRKTPVITWIKNRDATDSHMLFDKLRGPTKVAHPDLYASETTEVNTLQKFVPGGFQIGNDVQVNTTGESYVAWNWCMHDDVVEEANSAISGSGFTDAKRLVDKRVGLSVVTYTASAGTGTIDHGLGQTPDMIIATDRGHDVNWFVWHKDLVNAAAGTHILNLDSTAAEFNPGINHINDTAPTASAFAFGGYMGAHADTNSNGQNKMLYSFKSVPGFSAFGKYTGNGDADGKFVFTGHRASFLLIKCLSAGTNWWIFDNKRSTFNVVNDGIITNGSDTEFADNSSLLIDFLSNGFKVRNTYGDLNTGGSNHIFLSFAEQPFKYANAR